MIRISQYIDETLSIYRDNKVVIWGATGKWSRNIIKLLQNYEIEIIALCDNNSQLWDTEVKGISVISPAKLEEWSMLDQRFVVQSAIPYGRCIGLREQVNRMGIETYLLREEALIVLYAMHSEKVYQERTKLLPNVADLEYKAQYTTELEEYVMINESETLLLLCMPPKTGDNTVNGLLDNKIEYLNVFHSPEVFDLDMLKSRYQMVKIITAIREPIAQEFSVLFHMIAHAPEFWVKRLDQWEEYLELLYKDGGDVQKLYESTVIAQLEEGARKAYVQNFINRFGEHIVDIMSHPFNQEQGYTIIKEDNVEVFVYQLERLNGIIDALSEWVGVSFDVMENKNEASQKWIGDSYKQAQKELKFSREYFDKCYNEPYVKHFYSEADIEKFKDKWRKNICD